MTHDDLPSCCQPLIDLLDPALFKALSDPSRLAILCRLATDSTEQRVSEIATCCSVHLSVVSRHLAVLRDAGVLQARRHGKEVRYVLRTRWLARRLREIADAIEACCPPEDAGVLESPASE